MRVAIGRSLESSCVHERPVSYSLNVNTENIITPLCECREATWLVHSMLWPLALD